ncbi:ankyrin repeat and fibronectin type-III domain-containing protein 1 [Astyanax mexicanus]|uniref:ankyrin repeat and fibronectin type-III domain-containing protein 1 n=1 Tax=Astyanax mexicanus TaxID=7994 RepID=UPI0020CB498E|nr:ankyrin repeat and fibronectin type-III domain-containing protein 1 [Astyanax mexicanus]
MSRGLKHFFHSANKFVRLLQRGAYLATVFYHKDNILVTAEDQLPLVEIQCCSTSITQDFLWFAKLSCAWQQVPWLQQSMSSSLSSSSSLLQNRHCILRAISQIQASLGSVDLGQVYFEPLKDRHGNVLLVTLKEVVTPLTPADPQLHWSPLKHLETRWSRAHLLPEPTAMDTFTQQLRKKLEYHRNSGQRAQPGLYVGIVKLCSSVEQLRVAVPQHLPNLLLHSRIRNNNHVSQEEWSWIQKHSVGGVSGSGQLVTDGGADCLIDSSGVEEFVRDLRTAVTHLLTKLNIPLFRAYQYRLYTQELIQVGDEVSFLLLLPPSEEFSSSLWPLEGAQDARLTMPLHIFELVHFWVYSRELLCLHCEAWVKLELDVYLCQQALREALDSKEVSEARDRLAHITQLSQSVEAVWRERRWIMDVMQCVRSRQRLGAVPLHLIMGSQPIKKEEDGRLPIFLQTHTHTLGTGGTVCSSEAFSHTATPPVDIPGITAREQSHQCLPPLSYSDCTATSHSIPDTRHQENQPCSHSSTTFHHSGIGIHHIHSCPEFPTFPSSSLSISVEEEEEEKCDEEQNHGDRAGELLQDLDLQEEHIEIMYDLDSAVVKTDHTETF